MDARAWGIKSNLAACPKLSTSVNDNDVANEGTAAGDYTHSALDAHAASRSWGGS